MSDLLRRPSRQVAKQRVAAMDRVEPVISSVMPDTQRVVFPSLATVLLLAGFSLLEFRIFYLIHYPMLREHLSMTASILSGQAPHLAFQSRVLGPWIVSLAHRITHLPFSACYWAFCLGAVCAANGVCYLLFWKRGGTRLARLAVFTYMVAIVAFQDSGWMYLWDYIDLTTMMIFGWAVVMGGLSLPQLTALCLLELLNRESAQFIALWIMLDSVRINPAAASPAKFAINPLRLLTGVLLSAVCFGWTAFLRDKLSVPSAALPATNELGGQMWMLPQIPFLLKITSPLTTLTLFIFLGTLCYLFYRAIPLLGSSAWNVGLLICTVTAANVCFAIVTELRVWLTLLPLLPCLAYAIWRPFQSPALHVGLPESSSFDGYQSILRKTHTTNVSIA